ncbi:replicative helicase loader/inhibitor [Fictibacillus gelatini]|uniref:replicative helicase loader/inhibitor n=1 Tax=Fictibacillus gelatini TaxID=225985 RepID=UPI00040B7F01|nr:replicative helicase loader/inhibitor [Fictibacillus gelatini]
MNRKEIINLLAIATANFPSMQEKDMKPTAILWEKALNDIDYNIAEKALLKVLSTSKFFPTISEIREAAADLTQPRTLDAMEAWGLIVEAIRRYGLYNPGKAMESLPDEVVEMVKQFTWRELCLSENPETLRAQFRMAWETRSKRQKELKALPTDIRQMIEGFTDKTKLISD